MATIRPLTVCFETRQPITHADVLLITRHRLSRLPGLHVISIQHVIGQLISPGMPDRWLVSVNNESAKQELLKGMFLGEVPLVVRAFSDVVHMEYLWGLKCQHNKLILEELQMSPSGRKLKIKLIQKKKDERGPSDT